MTEWDWTWIHDPKVQRIYIRDPVDGGSVLRNNSRDEIFDWCEENCKGRYWIGMGFGQFELECDQILFKLRWG